MSLERNAGTAQARSGERKNLEAMLDVYLAALADNDPSALPVTANATFIEQNQPLALGEGTWRTVSGIGAYKHYYVDVENSRVGFIGTAWENGIPALLDVLLQVEGDRICAVESYLIRDPIGGQRLNQQAGLDEAWLEQVPPGKRASRARLIELVDRYFQSLQRNDGKGDYSFFDRECNRYDHGLQTTNVKNAGGLRPFRRHDIHELERGGSVEDGISRLRHRYPRPALCGGR